MTKNLIDAANIITGEKVQIVNVNNGERLETYTIQGERGTGQVCLNGPAARRCQPGDVIIVIAYGMMTIEEAKSFTPTVVFPDTECKPFSKYELEKSALPFCVFCNRRLSICETYGYG